MQSAKIVPAAPRNIRALPTRLAVSIRRHGVPAALRRGWRRAGEWFREWRLGIRTVGSIDAALLDIGAENFGYQPIPYAAFDAALKFAPVGSRDVFVDLGCGLGRAVILAGTQPFRRVIGVEISAELCAAARENIRRAGRRLRASEVEIVEADAGQYPLPDDATTLLLFNPFAAAVVCRFLENVRRSLERAPRELTIIYGLPAARVDVLADAPWLRADRTLRIPDEEWLRLTIYRAAEGVA